MRALGIAILVFALAVRAAESPHPQLQQAIDLQTKGDLAGAAAILERLSRDPDRSLAARALLHLGECRERQAHAGARQIYQRLLREFGDRPEVAAEARRRLALSGAPHGPSPSLEIRQVWEGAPENIGSVSADGRLLAFVDSESGDVAIHDLRTGQNRRLTPRGSAMASAGWPRLSPDGKRVVYTWAGNELRTVTAEPAVKAAPQVILKKEDAPSVVPWTWSPDGKSIATVFSRSDDSQQLAWVSVADGAIRRLKSQAGRAPENVNASPDGRWLVYDLPPSEATPERDIFVISADGERQFLLVHDPADDYAPRWSPDGQAVLFVSNRTGVSGLWSVPVAEGQARGPAALVKSDLGQARPIGVTGDGVLYYAEHRGTDDIYATSLDPATGRVTGTPARLIERFIGRNSAPAWSPDGRLLAYYSNRDVARGYGAGGLDIVVRAAGGSERVFNGSLLDLRTGLRWTPDNKALLVIAKDPKAGPVFSLLDAATGALRPVARATLTNPSPAVHPNGRSFLAAGGSPDSKRSIVLTYDLATGDSHEVYTALPDWILRNLVISRDGTTLAFSVNGLGIYTLPVGGGEPRQVVQMRELVAREGLAWSADGRHLLFARASGPTPGELLRVPAEGGAVESTGVTGRGLSLLSPHPDGLRVAYTLGQYSEVTVWALENFLPAAEAAR